MLRSESEWFPRFIRYCRLSSASYARRRRKECIQDKAMLKRVAACEGWRQVQTLCNDYGETAFSDLVYELQDHTKMRFYDNNYLNLYFTQ